MEGRGRHDDLDLRGLLAGAEAAPPSGSLDAVAAQLEDVLGARDVGFLVADLSGQAVVRVTGDGGHEEVALEESPYGDVLRHQEIRTVARERVHAVLAPVTHRGDVVGVLELTLDESPDERTLGFVAAAAHALAYVVAANRQFTDLYEWGQRSTRFSLAAEIQRRLLPLAFTCEAVQATVAGWVEPAHSIGGDTFDYSLDPRTLHLSITDAMGHDVVGALLATLAVSSLRNGRRHGLDLVEQATRVDDDFAEHAQPDQFVTGQLVRIDLDTGAAEVVNAGHPRPYLLRHGTVRLLALDADLPFGLATSPRRAQRLQLEPGDRLVFVTDGMIERNAAPLDVSALLERTAGEHPREVVHALTGAVVDVTGGDLRDDATVLCVDWHGGADRLRHAPSGADVERATSAGD